MSHAGEAALAAGEIARREKRLDDAAAAFARASAMFREASDTPRLAHALSRQAQIARDQGDLHQAVQLQTESLALARGAAPPEALPHLIRHLADMLREQGDPAAAAPLYAEMMAQYLGAADTPPLELANATRSIACNAEALGDRADAIRHWQDARARYAALEDLFRTHYGLSDNPGVREAEERLAALAED